MASKKTMHVMASKKNMASKKTMHVLMLPWLAHGHISPYLELAKKLADRNFIIHLCSTPANFTSISRKIGEKYELSIRLVELHLPTILVPSCHHTTNGLPPDLMSKLKLTLNMAEPEFHKIVAYTKPDLLIYDFMPLWAPVVARRFGVPAVQFMTNSVTMAAYLFHFYLNRKVADFPFKEIHFPEFEKWECEEREKENALLGVTRSSKIVLFKSGFKETEMKYGGYLEKLIRRKVVQVGALVENPSQQELDEGGGKIFEWLDMKSEKSTVFVSFGSEYFLKKEDMVELALGLKLSCLNFIWVLRSPKGEEKTLEEYLPLGFLDRVGDRGLVLKGWAPQARILGHASIGGFVSHCGCSSMMESMKFGVPIVAMPMHLDQPLNARLVEHVGVGMEVKRDEHGRLQKEAVATAIKRVVVESDGEAVRTNARIMSEKIRANGDEEIDGVVQELVKICGMKTNKKRNREIFNDFEVFVCILILVLVVIFLYF